MAVAQIGRVVEQRFVIGAHVQIHRNHARGVDAGSGGVNGQLAHGNIGAIHAPVADAENFLRIGNHQQINILGAKAQRFKRSAHVFGAVDR